MQKKAHQGVLKSILKVSESSTTLAMLVSNAWAVNDFHAQDLNDLANQLGC